MWKACLKVFKSVMIYSKQLLIIWMNHIYFYSLRFLSSSKLLLKQVNLRITPVNMIVNSKCEYSLTFRSFTILSPCLCRHMCMWRVHLLWCGSLGRLGWHSRRVLRVWREKLPCHVRQILGWFLFRWSTSWNISDKHLILIITLCYIYKFVSHLSLWQCFSQVEMVSFVFIKPPQKEMVHIPKSSSKNTDICWKQGRVELLDIRSLHDLA